MEMIYSNSELGCAVLRLPFLDWLGINEPDFFGFMGDHGGEEGLNVQHIPSLSAYSVSVSLVRVSDVLYKLDGSQRKEAWLNGKLPTPEFLIAQVFNMTVADFLALTTEAKTKRLEALPAHELVKSVYTDLGLVFVSDRLRNGFINEAIHIALRGRQRQLQDKRSAKEKEDINMIKAIGVFTQELKLIDGLNPKADIFATGVLAGALIMLGLNKPIMEFLKLLNDHCGEVRDELVDPVESLLKAIHRHRISQRSMQPRMAIDLCKKTIQAISIWLEGDQSAKYWRKRDLTGLELMPVIQEMKRLKQINAKKDL
jgi:hypothetical protein